MKRWQTSASAAGVDRADRRLAYDGAGAVAGVGRGAELDQAAIALVGGVEELGDLRAFAEAERQQAGGEGIQRAEVADLGAAREQALDAPHHVGGGQAVGLVDEQDAVHDWSPEGGDSFSSLERRSASSRLGSNSKTTSGATRRLSWRAICRADEAGGAAQAAERAHPLLVVAEGAEVDARMAQVGRDAHGGDGDEPDAGILDVAHQQAGDERLNRLADAIGAPAHRQFPPARSDVQDLDLVRADFGDVQVVDEADHLAQRALDIAGVTADL